MTEPNEQYAYFSITGEFDPATFPALQEWPQRSLGGSVMSTPALILSASSAGGRCNSRLEKSCELEAHIADVVGQLAGNRLEFKDLSLKYEGVMQFVEHFKTDYPGLYLDRGLIESLAEYALSVDFDFYYLYSDDREDSF